MEHKLNNFTEIIVRAPKDVCCGAEEWGAHYAILGDGAARLVRIKSRSAIDVVVAKITEKGFLGPQENYYISSPNFSVAIPGISSLLEEFWIMEQLLNCTMPAPDAVTIAAVLRDFGDF